MTEVDQTMNESSAFVSAAREIAIEKPDPTKVQQSGTHWRMAASGHEGPAEATLFTTTQLGKHRELDREADMETAQTLARLANTPPGFLTDSRHSPTEAKSTRPVIELKSADEGRDNQVNAVLLHAEAKMGNGTRCWVNLYSPKVGTCESGVITDDRPIVSNIFGRNKQETLNIPESKCILPV